MPTQKLDRRKEPPRAVPAVIPLQLVAERYGLSPLTVKSAAWRKRAGLRVTRIGRRIVGVMEADLVAAMRREGGDAA